MHIEGMYGRYTNRQTREYILSNPTPIDKLYPFETSYLKKVKHKATIIRLVDPQPSYDNTTVDATQPYNRGDGFALDKEMKEAFIINAIKLCSFSDLPSTTRNRYFDVFLSQTKTKRDWLVWKIDLITKSHWEALIKLDKDYIEVNVVS